MHRPTRASEFTPLRLATRALAKPYWLTRLPLADTLQCARAVGRQAAASPSYKHETTRALCGCLTEVWRRYMGAPFPHQSIHL